LKIILPFISSLKGGDFAASMLNLDKDEFHGDGNVTLIATGIKSSL
jgi:hypothetical protein